MDNSKLFHSIIQTRAQKAKKKNCHEISNYTSPDYNNALKSSVKPKTKNVLNTYFNASCQTEPMVNFDQQKDLFMLIEEMQTTIKVLESDVEYFKNECLTLSKNKETPKFSLDEINNSVPNVLFHLDQEYKINSLVMKCLDLEKSIMEKDEIIRSFEEKYSTDPNQKNEYLLTPTKGATKNMIAKDVEVKHGTTNETRCHSIDAQTNVDNFITLSLSLIEGNWVTDDSIQVFFGLLNSYIGEENKTLLLSPAVSKAVKCMEDLSENILPKNISEMSYLIVPINDADLQFDESRKKVKEGSGSHWSLLLYIRSTNTFCHYDSISTYNTCSAKTVASKLSAFTSPNEEFNYVDCKTTQQGSTTKSDCGIFLMAITEAIISSIINKNHIEVPNFTDLDIWTKRAQLAALIYRYNQTNSEPINLIDMLLNNVKSHKKNNEVVADLYRTKMNSPCPQENKKKILSLNWNQPGRKKTIKKTHTRREEKQYISLENRFDCLSMDNNTDPKPVSTLDITEKENTIKGSSCKSQKTVQKNKLDLKYSWINPKFMSTHSSEIKPKPILIIGDSILKHVKVMNGEVRSFSGATAARLSKELENEAKQGTNPETVILHIGTNDLSNLQNPDDLMGAVRKAIITTQKCFPSSYVAVNGIIPRRNMCYKLIDQANKNIRWLCHDLKVVYVDLSKYITQYCLARDGVHLNRKGISILNLVISRVIMIMSSQYRKSMESNQSQNDIKAIDTKILREITDEKKLATLGTVNRKPTMIFDMYDFPPLQPSVLERDTHWRLPMCSDGSTRHTKPSPPYADAQPYVSERSNDSAPRSVSDYGQSVSSGESAEQYHNDKTTLYLGQNKDDPFLAFKQMIYPVR